MATIIIDNGSKELLESMIRKELNENSGNSFQEVVRTSEILQLAQKLSLNELVNTEKLFHNE